MILNDVLCAIHTKQCSRVMCALFRQSHLFSAPISISLSSLFCLSPLCHNSSIHIRGAITSRFHTYIRTRTHTHTYLQILTRTFHIILFDSWSQSLHKRSFEEFNEEFELGSCYYDDCNFSVVRGRLLLIAQTF